MLFAQAELCAADLSPAREFRVGHVQESDGFIIKCKVVDFSPARDLVRTYMVEGCLPK